MAPATEGLRPPKRGGAFAGDREVGRTRGEICLEVDPVLGAIDFDRHHLPFSVKVEDKALVYLL